MRTTTKVLLTLEHLFPDEEVRLGVLTSEINQLFPRRILNPLELDNVRQTLRKLIEREKVMEIGTETYRLLQENPHETAQQEEQLFEEII